MDSAGNNKKNKSWKIDSNPNKKIPTTPTMQTIKMTGSQGLSIQPVRPEAKQTIPQKNVKLEPMQSIERFSGTEERKAESSPTKKHSKIFTGKFLSCSLNLKLKTPRFHSKAALDRLETTITKLLPIPEVVWQQPLETSPDEHKLDNFDNDLSI